MSVIEINGLHKEYRSLRGKRTAAIAGLDLVVDSGGVFGFLGPNGSGKTTTIRCLLGLARPDAGVCKIFGRDSTTDLHGVIDKVGAIVEGPALFPNFSGRTNLVLLADAFGIHRARVDAVLEQVGLRERDKDLVKTYSLGMRQRLAIAAALLKSPELLILDEPANGLDPAGIVEVRGLVRQLAAEGRTVFVSSHILAEVQQMCDRVAILSRGRCVAAGAVDDVLKNGRTQALLVRVEEPVRAAEVLRKEGYALAPRGDYLAVESAGESGAAVTKALADRGLYPSELRPETVDLETVFLELTAEQEEAAAGDRLDDRAA